MKKEVFIAGVIAFIGILIVLAALGIAPPDPILIGGYMFSGVGVALLLYAILSKDNKFYLAWGFVFLLLGLGVIFREKINPLIFLGVLLVILAIIGVVPIKRRS